MTTASLQIISAVLRVHEHGGFGSPWKWSAPVVGDPWRPDLAIIMGAATAPALSDRPAIAQALWTPPGFVYVTWGRKNDGKDRRPEFPVEKWLR